MYVFCLQELAPRANVGCMATPKDLPRDIGGFIRDLRHNARISLRQLAEQTGVSNPYLSQIERGLRKPSAEVLQQLASALRVSTPVMYLRAGLLDSEGQPGVLAAIAVDAELTVAQKQSLSQIYETFRGENQRHSAAEAQAAAAAEALAAQSDDTAEPSGPADDDTDRPEAAVLAAVLAAETGAAPAPGTATPTSTPKPAKKATRRAATKAAPAVQEETS
jgi:transcriptional regulator with XRE-family HTH domain